MSKAEGGGPRGEGGIGGSPRRGGRPAGAALLGLALSLALGACGIEEYIYFYPPAVASDPLLSVTPLSFSHNASNDSASFLGYDIYYLLVDAENETFLSNCATKIEAYIGSKTPSELMAIIKQLGFKELVGLDSTGTKLGTTPLFLISQGGLSSSPDIDFQLMIDSRGEVAITGADKSSVLGPASVRRNSDVGGVYRTFGNLTEDDVAKDGDTAYLNPKPAKVVFKGYILAHGTTSSWSDVYSNPTRIGSGTTSTTVVPEMTDRNFE